MAMAHRGGTSYRCTFRHDFVKACPRLGDTGGRVGPQPRLHQADHRWRVDFFMTLGRPVGGSSSSVAIPHLVAFRETDRPSSRRNYERFAMNPVSSRFRAPCRTALVLAALIFVTAGESDGKPPQRYGSVMGASRRWRSIRNCTPPSGTRWPRAIRQANMANYSIFLGNSTRQVLICSAYEYVGSDFRDMANMGRKPQRQKQVVDLH